MKTKILFPNRLKIFGWILLIPATFLGVLSVFEIYTFDFLDNITVFAVYSDEFPFGTTVMGFIRNNISNEILGVLWIIGASLVAFSREKHEDEFIAKIRMESLFWATYFNYAILIFCILFFYGSGFYYVMVFNMFTILIFFISRFHYMLYKTKNALSHEK